MQEATGESVELAYADRGHASEQPAAEAHNIRLEVVERPSAKKGFVLLPRMWVLERSFAWASRFRRLAKGYERPPGTVAGLHLVAFACLFLHGLSWLSGRYVTRFRERGQDIREKQSFWKHLLSEPSGEKREEKATR